MVDIITRREWGAEPPKPTLEVQRYNQPLEEVLDHVVIHHSAFPPDYPIKKFQNYFQNVRRFDDVAYHFLVGPDGKIYEGRSLEYIGAHAGMTRESLATGDLRLDPDYGSIGIELSGCFDTTCSGGKNEPTLAQLAAVESLLVYLIDTYPRLNASGILFHNEVDENMSIARGLTPRADETTACPGDALVPGLTLIRERLLKEGAMRKSTP